MSEVEKSIIMLQSKKASVRYEACEELRLATESSPEIVYALERALNDADAGVAEGARDALDADVHQQMAIEMGKAELLKQTESKVTMPTNQNLQNSGFIGSLLLGFLAFWPYLILAYFEYFFEYFYKKGVWRGFPEMPIIFGCFSGIPFGIAGVVLGVIYLKKAPRNKVNNARSIIGILLGVGGIIGHIWYIFTCKFCN